MAVDMQQRWCRSWPAPSAAHAHAAPPRRGRAYRRCASHLRLSSSPASRSGSHHGSTRVRGPPPPRCRDVSPSSRRVSNVVGGVATRRCEADVGAFGVCEAYLLMISHRLGSDRVIAHSRAVRHSRHRQWETSSTHRRSVTSTEHPAESLHLLDGRGTVRTRMMQHWHCGVWHCGVCDGFDEPILELLVDRVSPVWVSSHSESDCTLPVPSSTHTSCLVVNL